MKNVSLRITPLQFWVTVYFAQKLAICPTVLSSLLTVIVSVTMRIYTVGH